MLGLDFHVVSIFCLYRSLNKIHAWNFFFSEKSLLMENQKRKKVLCIKKGKKIPLWKRLILVELHAGVLILNKEVAVEPKLAIYDVKNEAPPLHASTSLDKKLSPRIVILKAVCRLIVLLLNTVCSFSIFAAGFSFTFSNFAHYCVVLFNALRCDRDKK